jgi:hypothetical protein
MLQTRPSPNTQADCGILPLNCLMPFAGTQVLCVLRALKCTSSIAETDKVTFTRPINNHIGRPPILQSTQLYPRENRGKVPGTRHHTQSRIDPVRL